MKKLLLTGIAALLLATGPAHAQEEKKTWSTYCHQYVFNEWAADWQKNPKPDAVNQKPWIDYCQGYLIPSP
jgi:hypothetical protein